MLLSHGAEGGSFAKKKIKEFALKLFEFRNSCNETWRILWIFRVKIFIILINEIGSW